MSIPKETEGNIFEWIRFAKKKHQRMMDAEWQDLDEAATMMNKQSVQFEHIRNTLLDVKSFVESIAKKQEDTNNKLLDMIVKINAKIDDKK